MNSTEAPAWLSRVRRAEIVQVLKTAGQEWYGDKTFRLGAALAFYAVFAVAPLLVATLTVAGMVFGKDAAQGRLMDALQNAVSAPVARAIEGTLGYAYVSGTGAPAVILSGLFLLFGAMGLFGQLQDALDTIWDVKPRPGRGLWGVLKDRFWSFLAMLAAGVVLLAALLANVGLAALASLLSSARVPGGPALWHAADFAASFVALTLLVALIYRALPDVEIDWKDVWVGSCVTALLVTLGNYLIGLYLRLSGMQSAYGAAGSVLVLLLWVYYSSQVFLFGAEITQAHARQGGRRIRPSANAVPLRREDRERQNLAVERPVR